MSILLAAVLMIAPLILTPAWELYYDITPKVALILLGCAAALPLATPELAAKWRSHRELRRLAAITGLALVSLALSTVLSASPALSVTGSVWRRSGLIVQSALLIFTLVTAAHLAGDTPAQHRLLRMMTLAAVPVALYGILQYFGWDPWLPSAGYHAGEGIFRIVRPPATLGHAGYFANFLLPCTFTGIGLAWLESNPRWRMLGFSAAALCAAAIVLSGTRAAILGLLAGGASVLVMRRPRLSWRHAAVVVLTCLAAAAFYRSPAGLPLRARVRWSLDDVRGGARLLLWRDTTVMASQRWLAGWGPETFSAEFPRYQSRELSRAYPDFYHESPHNLYLDALAAQGVPGLLAWLAFTGFGFAAAARLRRRDPARAAALGGAWTATLAGHQFEVFTAVPELYALMVLALLAAAGEAGEPVAARAGRWRLAAAPLCLLFSGFAVWLVAADRIEFTARAFLERGRIVEAARWHGRARALGVADDLWFASASAALAGSSPDPWTRVTAWQVAAAASERACRQSEAPQNACYLLARLYASRSDIARTEASLRRAAAASPGWFKPHWMLAQVLALRGDTTEARREAVLAESLDGGHDAAVTATLARIIKP